MIPNSSTIQTPKGKRSTRSSSRAQIQQKDSQSTALKSSSIDILVRQQETDQEANNLFSQLYEEQIDYIFQKRQASNYPYLSITSHQTVTSGMRALLFNWMVIVASDHRFTRDTYSLSTALMDLYLNKKQVINKNQFQAIGYAAVCLAGKLQQNKSIANLGGDLFQKSQILKYQQQIMQILEFQLNPDTYIYWDKLLMNFWDTYNKESQSQYKNITFLQKDKASFVRTKQIFQLSDVLNLDSKSASFDKQIWVKNLFFIITRRHCKKIEYGSNINTFIKNFYCQDKFFQQYSNFIRQAGLSRFNLNVELGAYIFKFLGLKINQDPIDYLTQSWNQYISIQTLNQNIYPCAVKIIKK